VQPDHHTEGDERDEQDCSKESCFGEDYGDLDGAAAGDGVGVGGKLWIAEPVCQCVEPGDAYGEYGDRDQWEEIGDEPAEFACEVHLWCDGCGEDEIKRAVFSFACDGGGGHVDGDERDEENLGEGEGLDNELEVGGVELAHVVEDNDEQCGQCAQPDE